MALRVLSMVVVILLRCRWYCDAGGTNDGRNTAEGKDDFGGSK